MNFTVALTLILVLVMSGFGGLAFLIHKIGLKLNGRLTELLKVTETLAHAQGLSEGIAQERAIHEHD